MVMVMVMVNVFYWYGADILDLGSMHTDMGAVDISDTENQVKRTPPSSS
jgi:hypothetical protein